LGADAGIEASARQAAGVSDDDYRGVGAEVGDFAQVLVF
jgi:NAD/NADP transhydrogenase alpha subunit